MGNIAVKMETDSSIPTRPVPITIASIDMTKGDDGFSYVKQITFGQGIPFKYVEEKKIDAVELKLIASTGGGSIVYKCPQAVGTDVVQQKCLELFKLLKDLS